MTLQPLNVSYRMELQGLVLAVSDDQQNKESSTGFILNAQNVIITGGTFMVSLCCSYVCDLSTNSIDTPGLVSISNPP